MAKIPKCGRLSRPALCGQLSGALYNSWTLLLVELQFDKLCPLGVRVHFGSKTLRTQDISALCLVPECLTFLHWCQTSAPVHETLRMLRVSSLC